MRALGPTDPTTLPLPVLPFQFGQTRMQFILTKCKTLGASIIFHPYSLTEAERLSQINTAQHTFTLLGHKPLIRIHSYDNCLEISQNEKGMTAQRRIKTKANM